jgi:protocatechuate 3,4-dioxygenase beta subunit
MRAWLQRKLTRRRFIAAGGTVAMAAVACSDDEPAAGPVPATAATPSPAPSTGATQAAATAPALAPTPACGDDDEPTVSQTEGPYFSPNSPERASLRDPGLAGTPLTVHGRVLTTGCEPVAGALLDFWQADSDGMYDNEGFTLRGHQFTDAGGAYALETILPGLYPGRTRHIHVKAQAPDGPVLTTQLYFPGEAANASDGIFDPALVMDVGGTAGAREGTFDFVLSTA